jgi:hypothetical protein
VILKGDRRLMAAEAPVARAAADSRRKSVHRVKAQEAQIPEAIPDGE